MDQDRWLQIEDIFHAAEKLPADQRKSFLDSSCHVDDELRQEIESLLDSHNQVGSFFDYSPDDVAAGMIFDERSRYMIGRKLGHYELKSMLGTGGMGEVYRAHDSRLNRDVAIKILPEHLAQNPESLHRFEREVRAVAALSHPNILSIFEFGTDQNESYAVMELLEGETLRDRLKRGRLEWPAAVEIGIAIAEGLDAAHAKGIIHRDLKPANIFLTTGGTVKILDFGIAKVKTDSIPGSISENPSTATTQPGTIIGTIGYMSPEQVNGKAVDATSDIFSLGCVLYEMVSGQRAFHGETGAEIIAAILKENPPRMTDVEIPPDLETVIHHCLEKSPKKRLQSALEVASHLRSILSSEDQSLAPTVKQREVKRRSVFRPIIALTAFLLLIAAFWFYWTMKAPGAIDSLAVLPLVNAAGDANLDYLTDGLTDTLIDKLSRLPRMKVISRNTVFEYKNRKDIDPRKVGKELNVQAVVNGTMVQRGDTINLQVELVSTADGTQIWGERYSRNQNDLSALQEEITRQISEKVRPGLSSQERKQITGSSTANAEAYRYYFVANYYSRVVSPESMRKGVEYMLRAIDLDPSFALGYAGLANAYVGASTIAFAPEEAMPKARAAALKAIEMDNTLAEAYSALAQVKERFEHDRPGAEKEYRRAIAINPNNSITRGRYSEYLLQQGRVREAISQMAKAKELEPLSFNVATGFAWLHYLDHQYDEAARQLLKILDEKPDFVMALYTLGQVYVQKKMYDQARAAFVKARTLDPESPFPIFLLTHLAAVEGKRDEARKGLDQILKLAGKNYIDPFDIGQIYLELGNKDKAFEMFEKAFQAKSEQMLYLKVEPRLDSLRSDPRYIDLVRRLKLE